MRPWSGNARIIPMRLSPHRLRRAATRLGPVTRRPRPPPANAARPAVVERRTTIECDPAGLSGTLSTGLLFIVTYNFMIVSL